MGRKTSQTCPSRGRHLEAIPSGSGRLNIPFLAWVRFMSRKTSQRRVDSLGTELRFVREDGRGRCEVGVKYRAVRSREQITSRSCHQKQRLQRPQPRRTKGKKKKGLRTLEVRPDVDGDLGLRAVGPRSPSASRRWDLPRCGERGHVVGDCPVEGSGVRDRCRKGRRIPESCGRADVGSSHSSA